MYYYGYEKFEISNKPFKNFQNHNAINQKKCELEIMNGQTNSGATPQAHATADLMMSGLTGAPLNATKYMSECADYVRQHNIQEKYLKKLLCNS